MRHKETEADRKCEKYKSCLPLFCMLENGVLSYQRKQKQSILFTGLLLVDEQVPGNGGFFFRDDGGLAEGVGL